MLLIWMADIRFTAAWLWSLKQRRSLVGSHDCPERQEAELQKERGALFEAKMIISLTILHE